MVMVCVVFGDPERPAVLVATLLPELFTDPEQTLRYVRHARGGEACLVRSDGIVEWVPRHAVLSACAWVTRAVPPACPDLN